ncbi:HNH endonuclease [Streptomyces sp. adm13(2018)]|uniref:HNH endonuclease signature motif containing protein n=1 Tax=Streptomyces sp. adm13(2018) TaxID=2479007 RepID=UPI0011CD4F62|nr:HNH endonuclease signature motif containing protein [Streptomyces sp. adm13(2018)]TXS20216.1 HNH endonuclease [Streptomyces sp. adm13(2018)]
MPSNPRNGRPYRDLTARQRALHLPCWLCGGDINYALRGLDAQRSRWAFTLDHLIPLSRGGSLLDPANARSAHRRCNSAKGNRAGTRAQERTARRW